MIYIEVFYKTPDAFLMYSVVLQILNYTPIAQV